MRFAAQNWLFALLLAPAVWALLRDGDRRARARLALLLGARAPEHVESMDRDHRTWRRFLLLASICCLAVALARPQWGAREIVVKERGTDIVVALDISNSMRAEDVLPSRLERAKSELIGLLGELRRGRVGLVLFAGAAFVQCPLTLDHATAGLFLKQAAPDMISAQGTNVAAALATARDLLERGGGGAQAQRAIVLVTDGEDFEGRWEEEARRCRDAGIVVLAIGVGDEAGGLVPLVDDRGRPAGYLKDGKDAVVVTRFSPGLLNRLAEETGGGMFRIGAAGLDRARLRGLLERLGERELQDRRIAAYEERFVWPLGAAFVLLGVRFVLRPRREARRRGHGEAAAVRGSLPGPRTALLVLLWLAAAPVVGGAPAAGAGTPLRPPGAAEVDRGRQLYREGRYEEARQAFAAAQALNPDDPRLSNALGAALAELGRLEEAEAEFQRALGLARTPAQRAEALYNAGTCRLGAGDAGRAVALLQESLRAQPGQADARHNLELALRLQAQAPPAGEGQPEADEEQQRSDKESKGASSAPDAAQQEDPQPTRDQTPAPPEDRRQQPPQAGGGSPEGTAPGGAEESAEQLDPPPEALDDPQAAMDRERALGLLRALDRDEEQLRRSIQQRLRGEPPRSGKPW